jgi:hypothetical protein
MVGWPMDENLSANDRVGLQSRGGAVLQQARAGRPADEWIKEAIPPYWRALFCQFDAKAVI